MRSLSVIEIWECSLKTVMRSLSVIEIWECSLKTVYISGKAFSIALQ